MGAWFAVFPRADWAYYLFAMVLATAALWFGWRLMERYLDGPKRVIGLALLTFIPVFNFHALKFNNNAMSLPTWAATTWLFLRAFETRRADYAALAGLAAGTAMLSKYWSVFLLAGLGLAALLDRRRLDYLRSPSPWITIAVGALVVAPHFIWVATHGWRTFEWMFSSHPASDHGTALWSGVQYIAGTIGYLVAPVLIALVATRPESNTIGDMLWPPEPDRRLVVLAFLIPLLLPALAAPLIGGKPVSLWALGGRHHAADHCPVARTPRADARSCAAYSRVCGCAAACSRLQPHRRSRSSFTASVRTPTRRTIGRLRRRSRGSGTRPRTKPLRIVGSYENLLSGTVFYYRDGPSAFEIVNPRMTPWIDDARLARDGLAMVCPADNVLCMNALNARAARAPGGKRAEATISRTYMGYSDPPQQFVIATVPPDGARHPAPRGDKD